MSQTRVLRRRLRALDSLEEAVGALRALSAQHFRSARALLPMARAYRDEIARCVGALDAVPTLAGQGCGVVIVTTDLGLVGDYTRSLVDAALELRAEHGPGPTVCLGRRSLAPLSRAGVEPDAIQSAPTSIAALPAVLLPLVDTLISLRAQSRLATLWLVAARFRGAGQYLPVPIPVLPVSAPGSPPGPSLSSYCNRDFARTVIVREYLYATLYETLVEALASEHGKRLVTAESARSWLAERAERTRRRISTISRQAATQEVLEIVSATRSARRERGIL